MKTIEISNPPKMWWEGDKRVEPYMVSISESLERNGIKGGTKEYVDIYNRAYEAVYKVIKDYEKRTFIFNNKKRP